MRLAKLAAAALVLASAVAVAQDDKAPKAPKLVPFAPEWKKGDSWVVRTFVRDLKREITGMPGPAKGPRLPGFPPLRDGVPEGYKHANRWRVAVDRDETVTPEGAKPETYRVLALATTEGEKRTAELWFDVRDLALARVVIAPGVAGKEKAVWFRGRIQLDPPEARELVFPLDWPDLRAASMKEPRTVTVDGRGTLEQTIVPEKRVEDAWAVTIVEKSGEKRGAECVQRWKKGAKFWSWSDGENLQASVE